MWPLPAIHSTATASGRDRSPSSTSIPLSTAPLLHAPGPAVTVLPARVPAPPGPACAEGQPGFGGALESLSESPLAGCRTFLRGGGGAGVWTGRGSAHRDGRVTGSGGGAARRGEESAGVRAALYSAPRAGSGTSLRPAPRPAPAPPRSLRPAADTAPPSMATPAPHRLPRHHAALLLGWLLAQVARAAGTPERAYNITWKSTNFKTILEWKPKPTHYVYTVQISSESGDWKSKCFSISDTECDLTDVIVQDIYQTYEARVLSLLPRNLNHTDLAVEPLFMNSPKFTPYLETKLGRPTIQSFERAGTKLNVTVQDARTLVRKNGTFLSLRQVFGKNLNYTLFYWKASSTGKKTAKTNTNGFLIDVDKMEDYCFSVQALIPSRKTNKSSPESTTECTSHGKGIFREKFFIVGSVVFVVIILIIVLSISIYKCRLARARRTAKESSLLNVA